MKIMWSPSRSPSTYIHLPVSVTFLNTTVRSLSTVEDKVGVPCGLWWEDPLMVGSVILCNLFMYFFLEKKGETESSPCFVLFTGRR